MSEGAEEHEIAPVIPRAPQPPPMPPAAAATPQVRPSSQQMAPESIPDPRRCDVHGTGVSDGGVGVPANPGQVKSRPQSGEFIRPSRRMSLGWPTEYDF